MTFVEEQLHPSPPSGCYDGAVADSRNPLPLGGLSGQELLVLMEMCLDAEERCERRRQAASASGDEEAAGAAADMGQTYRDLKVRLFMAMKHPTDTGDVQEVLQQVRRELSRLDDSRNA
jgi:hypothetical protein